MIYAYTIKVDVTHMIAKGRAFYWKQGTSL